MKFAWVTVFLFIFSTTTFAANYPPDPTTDTEWPFPPAETTVEAIESRFNTARAAENASLPELIMPSQAEWDSKSDTEKVLWLINEEREARGVLPLHSGEPNVISVAQDYAEYLLDNNEFGHEEDGKDPWIRLGENSAIGSCRDFLGIAENLAMFNAWGMHWTLPIERSVYGWMYDDGASSNWGHRHAILWNSYNDNSGAVGREGFLGIGTAAGSYKIGGTDYTNSIIVVMNVFDPCEDWDYSSLIVPGDVNGDMMLNLADAIAVLRILTGNPPTTIHPNADINDNDVIGMEEVIFILGELSK